MERDMMGDIKHRADQIDLKIDHVLNSQEKATALGQYLKNIFTPQQIENNQREELLEELSAVLKDTLGGLEELHSLLDAVEKLAVTSVLVFEEGTPFSCLPEVMSPLDVQAVINAARLALPLLITLKREAEVFFLPSLHNVPILALKLDTYISSTQDICKRMEERMDQHFRLAFMFQEDCKHFISLFSQCQPKMLQFLTELEERAVQLDRMNTGAKISSVAGSSVGVLGGVLSIAGLALIPVTLGASLALTITGVSLGVTSGVNSAVTTATEMTVNINQQKKVKEIFTKFKEHMQRLQECLDQVANRPCPTLERDDIEIVVGAGKIVAKVGTVGKSIDAIADMASSVKLLKSEDVIAGVTKVALQEGKAGRNLPKLASDIPDFGQAAVKGPLALSNSARAGLITVNALFIGLDVFFICKDSMSLAKGKKSETSQLIRDRAALWHSEIDAWQRMRDSLCEGMLTSGENQGLLEKPLSLEVEGKKKQTG
ncbi:apolipoprotein L3 [Aplochiton taeniatus]